MIKYMCNKSRFVSVFHFVAFFFNYFRLSSLDCPDSKLYWKFAPFQAVTESLVFGGGGG
jgi:hypothetical protein